MILLAFGLGLLAGATIGGYLHARHSIYMRQYEAETPNQYLTVPEPIEAHHKDRDDPSYCYLCNGRCEVDP